MFLFDMSLKEYEFINTFIKYIENYISHPYTERFIIFCFFNFIFINLFSIFPFYPYHYIILFSVCISLLSSLSRSYALILGFIISVPPIIYQNISFSIIYISICIFSILTIRVGASGDWKIGCLLILSFVLAFTAHSILSMMFILLSGFIYGSKKGVIMAFFSSTLIILFSLGLNKNIISLYYLPHLSNPFLKPIIPTPVPFTIQNILAINLKNAKDISLIPNIFLSNINIPLHIITTCIGSYLSGNVQTWKIKYNSIVSMLVGSFPIILSFIFSEYSMTEKFVHSSYIIVPFILFVLIISLSSIIWRPLLMKVGIQEIPDLDLPTYIRNEIDKLVIQIENLKIENENLKRNLNEIEKQEPEIKFLKNIIYNEIELKRGSIDVSEICSRCKIDKVYVESILNELQNEGFILLHKDKIINKFWLKETLRKKFSS